MSIKFADLEHKSTEEQLAEAREQLRLAQETLAQIERVVATTITEDPEIITVPGDLDPRVKRGVAWLDENIHNWANRINLDTFNIRAANRCVLGQIYGEYADACTRHGLREPAPSDAKPDGWLNVHNYALRDHYGFQTWGRASGDAPGVDDDWNVLQESWERAIEFRQQHQ